MKRWSVVGAGFGLAGGFLLSLVVSAADAVPRFSVEHMDRSISPRSNFVGFASGTWVARNPVPEDKARWASFDELQQRNWSLLRAILEEAAADEGAAAGSPRRLVGDFFAAGMNVHRIEEQRWRPLRGEMDRLDGIQGPEDAARLVGVWHRRGIGVAFGSYVAPDAKDSGVYALYLSQGGLGLPDRDYYFGDGFLPQRAAYRKLITRTFQALGETAGDAEMWAGVVLDLETELARASRVRTALRDAEKNYHRKTMGELEGMAPDVDWEAYFEGLGVRFPAYVVVGQPEFFEVLNRLGTEREPEHWMAYLRWHLVRHAAPHVHAEVAEDHFQFFGKTLQGQAQMEPRWQRVGRMIDGGFSGNGLGESLGQLYVERHFPQEARERMAELVADVKEAFLARLGRLTWMSEETRAEAERKFARFTAKIGHPEKFRDESGVEVRRDDHLGNVYRAAEANARRQAGRVGQPVDRGEWRMTPPTVNAYFNPTQNEIVFPAGILQPPFFDLAMDDAVNYGAIGAVIGHEITHGYDDQGRKFDAEGNLRDWWTEADAREFQRRAEKLVEQYDAYEPVPGARVNGRLTLGENLADLGGVSIAYDALQRALARDPSKRRDIDGFTPEQRFFLAFAQVWRVNTREAELRRRLVVDPHAPPQFRAFGPLVNLPMFHAAFGIQPGDPMWKAPEDRADVW